MSHSYNVYTKSGQIHKSSHHTLNMYLYIRYNQIYVLHKSLPPYCTPRCQTVLWPSKNFHYLSMLCQDTIRGQWIAKLTVHGLALAAFNDIFEQPTDSERDCAPVQGDQSRWVAIVVLCFKIQLALVIYWLGSITSLYSYLHASLNTTHDVSCNNMRYIIIKRKEAYIMIKRNKS